MKSTTDRWSLILTAPQPMPETIDALQRRCEAQAASIDSLRTLTEHWEGHSKEGLWAVELALSWPHGAGGMPFVEEMLNPSGSSKFGFSLLPCQHRRTPKRLLAMDMDATLIEQEGIDELAREAGVYEKVSQITDRAMRGEMDFDESLRRRCRCLAGAPLSIFDRVRRRLTLTPGAEPLLRTVRQRGCRTALLSGGFVELGAPLAHRLGFDHFHANRLEVRQGRLTGRLRGRIVNAERKASIVRRLARRLGVSRQELVVLGDGANDLPMLAEAGLGIAFDAKPAVRQQARHSLSVRRLDAVLLLMEPDRQFPGSSSRSSKMPQIPSRP